MLEDDVRRLVAEQLRRPLEDVRLDTRLNDLVIDSIDLLEVVIELQEEFGVWFEEADIDAVVVIADAVALIRARRAEMVP